MNNPPGTKSLIDFPCHFPIKVMGLQVDGLEQTVFRLISQLTKEFEPEQSQTKPSSSGKYLSITCKVWVTNQDELDEVYRTLSTHPMVSVVL